MDQLYQPWPWYISGPLIAWVLLALLFVGKKFGMSSNLKTICTICGAGKVSSFFRVDWKSQLWNLVVVLGVIIGGFIGSTYLSRDTSVNISQATKDHLKSMGITDAGTNFLPEMLFSNDILSNPKACISLIVGGLLVGFGARYANGCTSGHAISGLSNLQLPSLIAVIGFFIGGLIMVHLLFPLIF
ncbi:YeeE/YedE family protein [Aquimarina pacifica]|uniref:YeeE/YedE family protein n=1 Tax=Aquimarina pacifica TaxID=1296415 RepID=UPI0004722628|nr:YeeE/YedE thiosulfate transporter family protein [Aquimarina pacifica]